MPDSEGIHGHGSEISGSIAGAIGHVRVIGINGQQADDLDISHMLSDEKWREFIAGMKDPGTLDLELLYTPENVEKVYANFGVLQEWTISTPDGHTFTCNGYIKSNDIPINFEDRIMQNVSLKASGKPVFV